MTVCVSCPQGHTVAIDPVHLGGRVACPCCFATFLADDDFSPSRQARKEEKNSRRSRDDDDDDDEEDEKPRKKKPAPAKPNAKAEGPKKKDEKPKKKPAAKKKDDEEEEEEDEGEEDEEDEAEEIDWTPRKRQLNLCAIGLMTATIALGAMMGLTLILMLALDDATFDVANLINAQKKPEEINLDKAWVVMLAYIAAPFILLTQTILLVSLGFSFAVPAKVEGRSLVIAGVVFGALFFLMGLLALLGHYQVIVDGEVRAERMVQLMGGGAALCFVFSLMATMAFQAKLMMFMRMQLESMQPISNVGFYFVFFAVMFVFFVANTYICYYLHYLLGFIMILAIDAMAAMACRWLFAQIKLTNKLRRAIQAYIRDA